MSNCPDFLQRLIRTEALPGAEQDLANLVLHELQQLGFQDVHRDEVGNVLGRAPGGGAAPGMVFNTHLDHVDVGDHAAWPEPPFEAVTKDGVMHGRGAVDIKGPLAAQVYAASRLVAEPGPGDVWVTAVVQEEVGGVGARHLAPRLTELCGSGAVQPLVIVGEPSSNQVRRGHRGRIEVLVSFFGRSAHASAPERASNPLLPLGHFLTTLGSVRLQSHVELGATTVAPTLLNTDQTSANVIPAEVHQVLDIRTVPGEAVDDLLEQFTALAKQAAVACAGEQASTTSAPFRWRVSQPTYQRTTYTGLTRPIPADNPTYLLTADHPAVSQAIDIVENAGGARGSAPWKFATDGGHFAAAGAAPVGFAPGDETLAHTVDERIDLDELQRATRINELLARELPARLSSQR